MEPRPTDEKLFLTVAEAAAILGLSQNTVIAGIKRGEVPGRRIGKKYVISKAAFNARFHDNNAKPVVSPPWS